MNQTDVNPIDVNQGDVNANLYHLFAEHFPDDRQAIALETETGDCYAFADLETESARLANFLVELGLERGDRVTVQVDKSPQALFLYLACLRSGLVFHPLNTGYQRNELNYFLGNAEPRAIVCSDSYSALLTDLADELNIAHVLTLNGDGSGNLMNRSRDCGPSFETVLSAPDELAALLYSSGTTGRPKGIMLSHENLSASAQSLVECWGFTENDVLLHALPIFHVHGLFVGIGCALMSGAKMIFLPKFDASQVVHYLPHSTVMMGVPTFYTRLLSCDTFTADVCRNMRLFISGSAPLLAETFQEFEQLTGHAILERYGMTETNMNTSNPLEGKRKAGTVGLPLPGVSVRIVDSEGTELAQGDIGDLQVKGANVFSGYWRMPEKTAEDFTEDGFFNTGDKGQIDSDGYVAIVGRAKDMVISGGLNIYPKEVELVIDDMPGVLESAVIGVPHADFGEAVVAVVIGEEGALTPDEAEVITHTKEVLAGFKVPKRVLFLDSLPRNTMGKVQKAALRDQFAEILNK